MKMTGREAQRKALDCMDRLATEAELLGREHGLSPIQMGITLMSTGAYMCCVMGMPLSDIVEIVARFPAGESRK